MVSIIEDPGMLIQVNREKLGHYHAEKLILKIEKQVAAAAYTAKMLSMNHRMSVNREDHI